MDQLLNAVPVKVTRDMNDTLLMKLSLHCFQMFPTKAPSPDGFPTHFLQQHWNICGEEVALVVLRILNGEDDPAMINDTSIVLIP